jgi:selenocysteine-specific elongation factor
MMKEEARSRLDLPPQTFALVLRRLADQGAIADEGAIVRLPVHAVTLTPAQRRQADAYLAALSATPFSPPGDLSIDAELLACLLDEGRVVRAAPDVIFAAGAYRQMADRVVARIREQGKVTLAEVRDMLGTSRKYVQALLEHLDQQRVTRRVGDERVLR